MIEIKDAVARAEAFASAELGVQDLLLEEIESTGDHFKVTLSFPRRSNPGVSSFSRYAGREYKRFDVNKASGHVEAMIMRAVET